jgi:hypothetical protein
VNQFPVGPGIRSFASSSSVTPQRNRRSKLLTREAVNSQSSHVHSDLYERSVNKREARSSEIIALAHGARRQSLLTLILVMSGFLARLAHENVGGRDRDRTGDPLLAKIARAKNQQLTRSATNCYEMLQVQRSLAVRVGSQVAGSTR